MTRVSCYTTSAWAHSAVQRVPRVVLVFLVSLHTLAQFFGLADFLEACGSQNSAKFENHSLPRHLKPAVPRSGGA